ncbi:UNVERIFIED_CONTAM: alpha/beta hydrolase [Actinomycetes bacterium ARC8]|nr:alpha/beta hydrolase [Actinomycetes bacterium ARC8]
MKTQNQAMPALPEVQGVEHEYVELADGHMHVATMGAGAPVLLLAGFGQTWWEWREVMPALAAAGYRAIAPDLRGEGWSQLPYRNIDRTSRYRDLLELLERLGLGAVRVVSHDMGSISAFQLALEHPGMIQSQVMIAVPPLQMRFQLGMVPGMRHLWHQEALSTPGLGPWLMRSGRMARHFFSPVFMVKPLDPDVFEQYASVMRCEANAGAAELLCRRMVLPELGRIISGKYRADRLAMPTLFVFGADDAGFPPAITQRIFSGTTGYGTDVRLATIDQAGHFVVDEQPAAVSAAIIGFFAALGE